MFVLNGIQTQSGDRYNLLNDLPSMHGLVDLVRISPEPEHTFYWLDQFQQEKRAALPQGDCNGYWHQLAGLNQIEVE